MDRLFADREEFLTLMNAGINDPNNTIENRLGAELSVSMVAALESFWTGRVQPGIVSGEITVETVLKAFQVALLMFTTGAAGQLSLGEDDDTVQIDAYRLAGQLLRAAAGGADALRKDRERTARARRATHPKGPAR